MKIFNYTSMDSEISKDIWVRMIRGLLSTFRFLKMINMNLLQVKKKSEFNPKIL